MSSLSLDQIRRLHNRRLGQVPFDELPGWRQEQVIGYWSSHPSLSEGSKKELHTTLTDCRGKTFPATRKLFEFISRASHEKKPSKVEEAFDPDVESDFETEELEPDYAMPDDTTDEIENALEEIEAKSASGPSKHGPINKKALELQNAVKEGDTKALNELFHLLMPLARGMTQNLLYYHKSDVEDVALQAMATMFDHIVNRGRWGEGKKITTFLRQFIRNASKNHARKLESRRRLAEIGIEEEHQAEDTDGDVMYARGLATATEETPADALVTGEYDEEFQGDFLKAVREMIDSLPELERKVMTAHALEDKSPDEIADELRLDTSKVRKRIRRARRAARKWLASKPEYRPLVNFFLEESEGPVFDPVAHLHRVLHPK